MSKYIEKLYKLCGFEKAMGVSSPAVLYPFTAEKQLELIKWLLHHKQTTQVELRYFGNSYYVSHCTNSKNKNYEYVRDGKARLFESSIADLFCDMWKSLTDDQKQEIKRILQ